MSKIVLWLNKIFPEAVEDVKTAAKKVSSNVDEAIAVAIAAIMARKANK
jgi:Na+-transporting methylmalonyl-CoA/oxaloacetate decarboxylase gamma subunit